VGILSPTDAASYPRRTEFSAASQQKPQNPHNSTTLWEKEKLSQRQTCFSQTPGLSPGRDNTCHDKGFYECPPIFPLGYFHELKHSCFHPHNFICFKYIDLQLIFRNIFHRSVLHLRIDRAKNNGESNLDMLGLEDRIDTLSRNVRNDLLIDAAQHARSSKTSFQANADMSKQTTATVATFLPLYTLPITRLSYAALHMSCVVVLGPLK
jgi:hypothetical protein